MMAITAASALDEPMTGYVQLENTTDGSSKGAVSSDITLTVAPFGPTSGPRIASPARPTGTGTGPTRNEIFVARAATAASKRCSGTRLLCPIYRSRRPLDRYSSILISGRALSVLPRVVNTRMEVQGDVIRHAR